MLRLDFHRPLTALEIRDPSLEICEAVAKEFDLFTTFHQPQQRAFARRPNQSIPLGQRVGNGKHKDWFVDFQEQPPQTNKPTVVGRLALKAPIRPDQMQFGGFEYGRYGEVEPVYDYMTIHTPSELGLWPTVDPEPKLLAMVLSELSFHFVEAFPRLFPIEDYVT